MGRMPLFEPGAVVLTGVTTLWITKILQQELVYNIATHA